MDEPIRPRAGVPTEHKPRMRCGAWRWRGSGPQVGDPWWRCEGRGESAEGSTMEEAYARWQRALRVRQAAAALLASFRGRAP